MNGPQVGWLADGRRLHLNHGPIDLIIETFGRESERASAHDAAVVRFRTILEELVAELPDLRRPAGAKPRSFAGATARRMEAAVQRFHAEFITPMAAVAGSVADEIMAAMAAAATLDKAYVNDGGDIAIHLTGEASITAAIAGTGHGFADRLVIRATDPVRGIATSGWRGRSFSLGIADAVTVLASDAAAADAAATIIANAVDLPGHPAIVRQPANELAPDTDLGSRLATVGVGALTAEEIDQALDGGAEAAEAYLARGLIAGAALFLAGEARMVGAASLLHRERLSPARLTANPDGTTHRGPSASLSPGQQAIHRKPITVTKAGKPPMPDFPIRKVALLVEEILCCPVMSCGPRVHDRMGGLAAADIKAWDGLR